MDKWGNGEEVCGVSALGSRLYPNTLIIADRMAGSNSYCVKCDPTVKQC